MVNALKLENISKEFKNYKALDNVSFSLNKGEIVGLVGPNGAGKTTLMRIIVGLTKKYGGNIKFEGKRSVGCVIETPSFYPYMTGYENLNYFASMNDVKDKSKIKETIELLGLSNAINKKVKNYSLGMRQRLGIAEALITDPELLILDEPTNGLDPAGIHELREYIKKIAMDRNITVLISSHILSELEKLCHKAIIIKNGKVIENIDLINEKMNQSNNVVIEAENISQAVKVLNDNDFIIKSTSNNKIYLAIDKECISDIMDLLIKNGVKIYSVYEEKKTLEDTFLDLVDNNQIS